MYVASPLYCDYISILLCWERSVSKLAALESFDILKVVPMSLDHLDKKASSIWIFSLFCSTKP